MSEVQSIAIGVTAPNVESRVRGCLLAGAVGDAMGAPVEFMSSAQIINQFGSEGVRDYVQAYGRMGAITDDTQMTLFTADGLLRSLVDSNSGQPVAPVRSVCAAYLRWLATQESGHGRFHPTADHVSLESHKELHSARAPGRTCLSALRAMTGATAEAAQNNSKGCGGVMRAAPVGLFYATQPSVADAGQVFQVGADTAALTHGHPTGYLTSGVLAVLVQRLVLGDSLTTALALAKQILSGHPNHAEALAAIELAEALAASKLAPVQAIKKLGEGWISEEALAIGVYAAFVADTLESGIVLSVNHGGDSDSTGSIAGNLLGAMLGEGAIPRRWLDGLELRRVIAETADDLVQCWQWHSSSDEQLKNQLRRKYPLG